MNPDRLFYIQMKRYANTMVEENLHLKEIEGKLFIGWFKQDREMDSLYVFYSLHIPKFVAEFINEAIANNPFKISVCEIRQRDDGKDEIISYPILEPIAIPND